MGVRFRNSIIVGCALIAIWQHAHSTAQAQLRIVSYNTATANLDSLVFTARNGADTVLEAIGNESVGGISKPIDVLLLQEQFLLGTSTQSFVDLMNDLYDPVERTMYARSTINGLTSAPDAAGGRPGLVYNTHSVSLVGEMAFGTANGSNQARQTLRYQLRPVGYDASADFFVYNSHYKAGTDSDDRNRRLIEARSIRNNADALGQGAHILYAGDYNIQSSLEPMFTELSSAGNGQALDPISAPGNWHNNSFLSHTHTQAPAFNGPGDLVGGGVDDRFDFQLASSEFLDGEGLSILEGSYHAFGNNGTHGCCNNSITNGNGAAPNVLSALTTASDHLPVVADYQLPAVMSAELAALPELIPLGSSVSVDLLVENVANVVSVIGADELDYSVAVMGDLEGSFSGVDAALGDFNTHPITLDTSIAGERSGTVLVTSTSQSVMNASIEIPVSYVVAPNADFDQSGTVDGRDFLIWQRGFASDGLLGMGDANGDGAVDTLDLEIWQTQVASAADSLRQTTNVPEPTGSLLAMIAVMIGTAVRSIRSREDHRCKRSLPFAGSPSRCRR